MNIVEHVKGIQMSKTPVISQTYLGIAIDHTSSFEVFLEFGFRLTGRIANPVYSLNEEKLILETAEGMTGIRKSAVVAIRKVGK